VEPESSIASRYTPPICAFITEVCVWTVATITVSEWPMIVGIWWPSQTFPNRFPTVVIGSLSLSGPPRHNYSTGISCFDAVEIAGGIDVGNGLVVGSCNSVAHLLGSWQWTAMLLVL